MRQNPCRFACQIKGEAERIPIRNILSAIAIKEFFMRAMPLALLTLSLAAPLAHASSPDAWEEFRADVEKSCLASLPEALGTPSVFVEPTGTESFGIAAVEGLSPESKSQITPASAVSTTMIKAKSRLANMSGPATYHHFLSTLSTARNASCGISTEPTCFIRFLPAFCFSSSLRFRVTSPP